LLALDRLELEDRRAAQDRVVHVEVRVFRRGGDQRDAAVFDELEQRLLLFLIEILDLVEVKQHAVHRLQRVDLGDDVPDIGRGGRRAVQLAQVHIRVAGNDGRYG